MLAKGEVEGVERGIAQYFARYKGPFPIGSTVKIDNKDYFK